MQFGLPPPDMLCVIAGLALVAMMIGDRIRQARRKPPREPPGLPGESPEPPARASPPQPAEKPPARASPKRPPTGVNWAGQFWDWSDLCRHVLFWGGTGSGKTFSSNLLLTELIKAGGPMLFTCVKPDDFKRILGLARSVGHEHRVREITPSGPHTMNLLNALLHTHNDASIVAQMLTKIGNVGQAGGGGENTKFWESQQQSALISAITLCREVRGQVDIPSAYRVISSSPEDMAALKRDEWEVDRNHIEVEENGQKVNKPIKRNLCAQLIYEGYQRNLQVTNLAFRNAVDYLLNELPAGGDRMRGGVIAEVNNTLRRFINEPWVHALSGGTTFTPQEIDEKCLIGVLNHPMMVHLTPSRMWQFAWTLEAQLHAMRRPYISEQLPFIIVRDESGWALNPEWDSTVQIVARGQGLAFIDLVQDIDTLLTTLGGAKAKHEAFSFLSNHMHQVLMGSNNSETNQWASRLIGKRKEIMLSGGGGGQHKQQGGASLFDDVLGISGDMHWNESYQDIFRPEEFARLPVGVAMLISKGNFRLVDFRR